MSHSLNFARELAADIRSPTVRELPNGDVVITGQLDTGVALAAVVILVTAQFKAFKRTPPKVWCEESWVKVGADWHNGPPLCWVLPDEWRDVMDWRGKPIAAILQEGRRWLLDEVRRLLNRHYAAHLEGLTAWPPEWDSWKHFGDGVREYQLTKKRAKENG